ncbi:MAG: FAD-binding oxidoreductase [Chloroflexi bacterium]|nr:FAD-binding oxidoreductase [Chloroflexota bacterium]
MTGNPSSSYDAIIIGAGSVGVPAAFSMARDGLHVLVLDGNASVGQGSNKSAIGGIRATHSDPAKIHLGLRSIETFSTWEDQYCEDIGWRRGGYSFVAYTAEQEEAFKSLIVLQKSYGLEILWLDRPELLELIPGVNPEHLLGGTYSPNDGSASPLLAIHAMYSHACKLGASFHFNEPVTEIRVEHGRVAGVGTPCGYYSSPIVINAAGAHAAQMAKLAGIDIPVTPDAHEGGITEPVARFLEPMIVDTRPADGSANFYFYQNDQGQIVFCLTPHPSIWGYNIRETSSFLPMVARRMVEVIPRLAHLRVRRTWRGLYPMTPDGFPIIGWAQDVEGYLLAVGMCGQGFMLGPGLGELLSRMSQHQLMDEDERVLKILSPARAFTGQEKLK